MNSEQLFVCSQEVLQVLERSALVPALQACLSSTSPENDSTLNQSYSRYLDSSAGYTGTEAAVASHAGLADLQSPSFWFDLDTGSVSEKRRKRMKCLKLVVQGQLFLWHLGSLVQDQADQLIVPNSKGEIKLHLVDAVEQACDPDRISRLIDGVDLIYRACARLAGTDESGLKVMRLGGSFGRTLVLNGNAEPATATRRIVRAVNDLASSGIHEESYAVEEIADSNPFLLALDDLFRVGAVGADDAEDIRQGVLTGSIMVLECGARLYGAKAGYNPLVPNVKGKRETTTPTGTDGVSDTALDSVDELEYLIMDLNQKYQ